VFVVTVGGRRWRKEAIQMAWWGWCAVCIRLSGHGQYDCRV
jgi:hypothetical protein